MVNSAAFAKRLQKIIDFYGLSASSFADALAVNRSSISHLLSGRNKPSLDFVVKVLENFPEVELYWLLNGKGSFPKTASSAPMVQEDSFSSEKKATPVTPPSSGAAFPSLDRENAASPPSSAIERIVVFYADGTFRVYNHQ